MINDEVQIVKKSQQGKKKGSLSLQIVKINELE